jgi:hypothetical protein
MLELLDLPRVVKLEEFVGPLLQDSSTARYNRLRQSLQEALKGLKH